MAGKRSKAPASPASTCCCLLIVGGLNTAISLFYYLRVVKVMTMDDEPRDRPPLAFSDVSLAGAFLWLITLPTALLIVSLGLAQRNFAGRRPQPVFLIERIRRRLQSPCL